MFRHVRRWARRNPETSIPLFVAVGVIGGALVVLAVGAFGLFG